MRSVHLEVQWSRCNRQHSVQWIIETGSVMTLLTKKLVIYLVHTDTPTFFFYERDKGSRRIMQNVAVFYTVVVVGGGSRSVLHNC